MSVEDHIIKTTVRYEFVLMGGIDSYDDYKDLLTALRDAQDGDSILLKINSPGGNVDVGMMIAQAMKKSAAVTVCDVVYPSASMASIIALAGDYLVMQPHTFLMFHTYFTGMGGKSGDVLQMMLHDDTSLKAMMSSICSPFLTNKELKRIHDGEDLYIRAEDATLPARLKRHYKDVQINQ